MRKNILVVLLIIETLVLLVVFGMEIFIFQNNRKLREVYRGSSEDGCQSIIIYEIGEPDWPFGNAHYKVFGPSDFYVDVADDGGYGWYRVEWKMNSVVVTFGGSEQGNSVYELPFK